MMLLMMLPSLSPTLWRYHRALRAMVALRPGRQAMAFTIAYVSVWAAAAMVGFALAAAIDAEMRPLSTVAIAWLHQLTTSAVVVAAGTMQLTRWKTNRLTQCRIELASGTVVHNMITACRDGARLGMHCTASCAGYTVTLLVVGAMDPRVMFATTAAITAERVLPQGVRIARSTGVLAVVAGLIVLEHAVIAHGAAVR